MTLNRSDSNNMLSTHGLNSQKNNLHWTYSVFYLFISLVSSYMIVVPMQSLSCPQQLPGLVRKPLHFIIDFHWSRTMTNLRILGARNLWQEAKHRAELREMGKSQSEASLCGLCTAAPLPNSTSITEGKYYTSNNSSATQTHFMDWKNLDENGALGPESPLAFLR